MFLLFLVIATPLIFKNLFRIIKGSEFISDYTLFLIRTTESSTISRIRRNSYVLMKLSPRIIFSLFLNLSDFELQYSHELYSYQKRVQIFAYWSSL